jgi:hypothetical protein
VTTWEMWLKSVHTCYHGMADKRSWSGRMHTINAGAPEQKYV